MVGLPACSGRAAMRALERAGFGVIRATGSNHVTRHPGPPQRTVTVLLHGRQELKRATLASILKQANLSMEPFVDLL